MRQRLVPRSQQKGANGMPDQQFYKQMASARRALKEKAEHHRQIAYQAEVPSDAVHNAIAFEALTHAEEAIFGALNVLNAYLGDEDAGAAIDPPDQDAVDLARGEPPHDSGAYEQ